MSDATMGSQGGMPGSRPLPTHYVNDAPFDPRTLETLTPAQERV